MCQSFVFTQKITIFARVMVLRLHVITLDVNDVCLRLKFIILFTLYEFE